MLNRQNIKRVVDTMPLQIAQLWYEALERKTSNQEPEEEPEKKVMSLISPGDARLFQKILRGKIWNYAIKK